VLHIDVAKTPIDALAVSSHKALLGPYGIALCWVAPDRREGRPLEHGWITRAGSEDFTALVDYSHKPGAVEAVLSSVRSIAEGDVTVVLGCGGDRDRAKRPLMGEAAARLADQVVITNDNPRSEDPVVIATAMLEGVARVPEEERARVTVELDRADAIRLAGARARTGDVIVVAGKGHETGQYVKGEVLPFDDREVLRAAIEAHLSVNVRERLGVALLDVHKPTDGA
jgi:UDP-N-acetylmuramoyl-L-alanyl-D-glutamate--2,6-diaminopimelate ligase